MQLESVILVNELDEELGIMEKLEVHQKGLLHRAFSIFLFNDAGALLLQKRAAHKYHSAGLWTNTCCSHPAPGESLIAAGERRLWEELRITAPLQQAFSFIYEAKFENGLTEHEFDHVLTGSFNGIVKPVPEEVEACAYVFPEALIKDISLRPEAYTEWFKIAIPKVLAWRAHNGSG